MDIEILLVWIVIFVIVYFIASFVENLMKVLIPLFAMFVIFTLLWQLQISKGIQAMSNCFTSEARIRTEILKKAQKIEDKGERIKYVCLESLAAVSSLNSCLDTTKEQNNLSYMFYSRFPQFSKKVDETITQYNKICPNTKYTEEMLLK